jgi:hypothetical protein
MTATRRRVAGTGALQALEELPAGLCIEALTLAAVDEAAVAQTHGAEIAYTLAPREVAN